MNIDTAPGLRPGDLFRLSRNRRGYHIVAMKRLGVAEPLSSTQFQLHAGQGVTPAILAAAADALERGSTATVICQGGLPQALDAYCAVLDAAGVE